MSLSDSLGAAICKIKNAQAANKEVVDLSHSGLIVAVLKILEKEGFISSFAVDENVKIRQVKVFLKTGSGLLSVLKRVSRPGLRRYCSLPDIPRFMGGLGLVILSTPKGVVSASEAKKLGVGGEVLCYVF
jgi:small subunit ribosomal protein S8